MMYPPYVSHGTHGPCVPFTSCMLPRTLRKLVEDRLRSLALPVRLRLWDGTHLDLGADPSIALTLRRRGLLWTLLRGDVDGLGAAYVAGDLVVDGSLKDILDVGMALADRLRGAAWLSRLAGDLPRPRRRHSRAADAEWVRFHYDVSDEFYALWLDPQMVYSCAYFHTGQEDLATAQEQKLDHLCRKLRLTPGERMLDVGCGWGALLRFAARHYGVSGVGITLSEKQHAHARRRAAEDGLADRVDIRLQDYRDIGAQERFDKIVSVGMYEHVGRANLPLYFATLCDHLKAGGLVLNHGIATTDPEGLSRGPAGGSFIDRFVFPGGELPHVSQVIREMARQDLEVIDVESLRPHYALTLLHWVRRLEAQKDEAMRLAGAARYRVWRIYMAGCALAFERNWLSVYQVLAGKGDERGALTRPWTRRHQYVSDDPALLPAPLDWRGI
jgi:cyclopropane-fatty-acyl-phospholipid synthase